MVKQITKILSETGDPEDREDGDPMDFFGAGPVSFDGAVGDMQQQ